MKTWGAITENWIVMHGGQWSLENGDLVGRNGRGWTTNPEKSGSWLRTMESYEDFELEFEYAISKGGNSGVFFRSALEKNPAFTGYEMQIVDFHGREPSKHGAGAIYDLVGPSKNLVRPAGEWNHVVIRAEGPKIQIQMNGEWVLDHIDNRAQAGYIGLQNHDERAVVRFRNVCVKRL